MTEEVKTEETKKRRPMKKILVFCVVAATGIAAYVVFAPTVVKLPSAPPSVLTAEEYHQADSYCKSNGLEVEVSTHNRWIFAVACKRADGLLLAIPKAQTPADKRPAKMELLPDNVAPSAPPAPVPLAPAASGVGVGKPLF